MSAVFRNIKSVAHAMCNPVLWVSLLAPVTVYAALRLAQADIVATPNAQTTPAGALPNDLAAVLRSPHTKAILDYSLQVFTVVLGFVFWILSLFRDGVFKDAGLYLRHKDNGGRAEQVEKALTKSCIYFVVALGICLSAPFLLMYAGHLDVVRLYEAIPSPSYPWYSSWFFVSWNKIDGPPWSSPLTWMRVMLFLHGMFRHAYTQWHQLVDWKSLVSASPVETGPIDLIDN